MPKKPSKDNPKCPYCNHTSIKNGTRKVKLRSYRRYHCKACKKYFTIQPPQQKSKTYNLKIIIDTISNYNLGTPLINQKIPSSTIHNWIKNINLPMNRLRDKIRNLPSYEIIKKQRFIHHKQPFLYQYHPLKLEFAKKFPTLINYLEKIPTKLPKYIFENSIRISEASKETATTRVKTECRGNFRYEVRKFHLRIGFSKGKSVFEPNVVVGVSESSTNKELNQKQNYAVQLAKLAAAITKDNKKRHQIIEDFMLISDTATIAVEIPVYLMKNELETLSFSKLNKNLTGHIDILQLRFHKIYILDYKPEPINKQQTINQLKLYRKALSKRTNIPEHKFKLAFFNDKGYYEKR